MNRMHISMTNSKKLQANFYTRAHFNRRPVYDTVSVLNKMIFRLDDHLSRFENSCEQMEIRFHIRQEVKSICIQLVEKSQFKDAIFSLIGRRLHRFYERDLRTCKNGLIVVVVPLYNIFGMDKEKDGLKVSIVQTEECRKRQ